MLLYMQQHYTQRRNARKIIVERGAHPVVQELRRGNQPLIIFIFIFLVSSPSLVE